ncbi:hypothetical protein BW897_20665 [Bacillus cereus]|uniref:DUF2199 domain-containing protein n=1 Tax=Bacillus cereus TaxID=1396 RepID=A0A1S9TLA6_BACCE|nr:MULTISPECIES: DUF2199 domain-containing protein [Bacillus cereus group]OOR10773.1 hypothetical protein BW897_20665 [Bacillus cereus]OOR63619.1 hypothetical protein BLX04_09225 [Bacillus mycoides]
MRRRRSYGRTNKKEISYEKFRCTHSEQELPMSYGSDAPIYYYNVPEMERQKRFEINSDICIMDGEYYFVRGCIEIPIIDSNEIFIWNIWVSLSEESFNKTMELWEAKERETEEPYFGWLSTSIPGYPDTLNLRTHVHTRSIGIKPFIELEPTDHPLAIEQREGITLQRVAEIKKIVTQYNREENSE